MGRRSFVHVVCSPRPRVGKTLLARLLLDYFLANGRAAAGFDTNPYEPALAERFPDQVTLADIQTVQGQVALFDNLLVHDEVPKVVDLWHRSYDRFFALLVAIGFIEEAHSKSVAPLIFFIDGPDGDSAEAHALLRDRFEGLTIVSVRNDGASGVLHAVGRGRGAAGFPSEPQLQIPPLDPVLKKALDAPGLSLSALLRAPPPEMSIVVRAGLRAWLSKVFLQLQNFELRLSLSDAEYLR